MSVKSRAGRWWRGGRLRKGGGAVLSDSPGDERRDGVLGPPLRLCLTMSDLGHEL